MGNDKMCLQKTLKKIFIDNAHFQCKNETFLHNPMYTYPTKNDNFQPFSNLYELSIFDLFKWATPYGYVGTG